MFKVDSQQAACATWFIVMTCRESEVQQRAVNLKNLSPANFLLFLSFFLVCIKRLYSEQQH